MSSKLTTVKKLRMVPTHDFRLFHFDVLNMAKSELDPTQAAAAGTSSDEDKEAPKKRKVDDKQFIIQMYGINDQGETACIYVEDFEPYFYVKVADTWSESNMHGFVREVKQAIGDYYASSITDFQMVEKQKLYGFEGGKKSKYVRLSFKNLSALSKVKSLWYVKDSRGKRCMCYYKTKQGKMQYNKQTPVYLVGTELYEANLSPLLRFFHNNAIWPNGWVRVAGRDTGVHTTSCKYEFIVTQRSLTPLPDKESTTPYKIMSFDIEASSSHGDFPLPKKTYKRLAINIMDAIAKMDLNKDILTEFLQKAFRAAFGHGVCDGIDLVYPKKGACNLGYVNAIIDYVLRTSLADASKSQTAETARLLTLDSMFEKMKSAASATVNAEVEAMEDDDDDDAEEAEVVSESEEEDEELDAAIATPATSFSSLIKPRKTAVKPKIYITDVLLNPEVEREDKIKQLDELLTITFPTLKGDQITMIGSTFLRQGEKEPYLNHCIVLGSCEPVEGATIEAVPYDWSSDTAPENVDPEREVLMRWRDLIMREDPDIIIGYNIFGFDYEFMFRRAEETRCAEEFLCVSRKHGELCAKRDKFDASVLEIEQTKIAIASGEYDLRYINMGGRLQVDMYNYFRRNFNLSSYKLDDVASQNISDDVSKVANCIYNEAPCTELMTKNLTGLHKGDFIHIELSSFTSDYYVAPGLTQGQTHSQTKFVVLDIVEKEGGGKALVIAGHHEQHIDKSKKIRWGMAKDDVSPQDIFRMSKGSDSERAIVAKYCIQDCNLVHHLMRKIDVMTEYMEMANLCSVPISYLVFRGQGIKLTSYVAKKCMEKGYLMPDLEKVLSDGGYEGAIVLPPKTKIYVDEPVACVDYSSLYPSSMISQNYCHSSKVWAKEYDLMGQLVKEEGIKDAKGNYIYYGLPNYTYVELEFDTFEWRRNPANPVAKAQKTKVGKRVVCWAQLPNGEKSVMPSILMELLKAREDTKKKAKKVAKEDPFMANILDKRQLAYKVTANSLYGQCGARTSTFYEKDVAASTTASGRMSITYARSIIEEIYANRVCDVKNANHNMVMTNAEYVYGDSVASYTPVYVKVNNEVHICTIDQLASRFGNDGWRICEEPGKQEKEVCELEGVETWTDKGWTSLRRVIRHALAPHKKMMRILTHTGCVDVTDDHSLVRADGTEVSPKDVIVGTELLHRDLGKTKKVKKLNFPIDNQSIINAIHRINNLTEPNDYYPIETINSPDAIEAAHLYIMLKNKGYDVIVSCSRISNCDIYELCYTNSNFNCINKNAIQNMQEIPYTGYVYDLTTENHHFAAGVGNMIVHNTDSVFFIFNLTNVETGEKIVGKDALEITIELAQEAAHYATMFLKPPMNLAYEKTLMPFALLSKKRYVGILYEEDPNKGKLKYMGLSLKRRDSCDYLKDTYGQIINLVMKGGNIMDAIAYLNTSLQNLIDGAVPTEKLEITKALRGYYKNPQQIAHRVLADRIGQRDPGNMPKPGDRMRFLHVVNQDRKALQGDKIETPEYIQQAKLKIDYDFYITNQLMKPICQFMGLALDQIWKNMGKLTATQKHKQELAALEREYSDFEMFIKKKEKLCSEKVKTLLFDKYLLQIKNMNARNQPITNFFTKTVK